MAAPAFAQSSLSDQINSVYAVQRKQDAARRAEQQKREAQRKAEHAAALRAARERQADAEADEERRERYVDKLRALKIQQQELKLQAEKDRLAREDKVTGANVRKENAETDLIKSRADANNNAVSSGPKTGN